MTRFFRERRMLNKWLLIAASIGFLVVFCNWDRLQGHSHDEIMNTPVLPMEEIEALYAGKEDAFMWPEISLAEGELAYDIGQNMLLIPQSLASDNFEGALQVPDGELYFMRDETFTTKAEAIGQNQVLRLFWIRENQSWMYNVYFTGMPVMNIITDTSRPMEGEVSFGEVWVYDQYRESTRFQRGTCNWHLRGATTRNYEKASYKLSLEEEKYSFLGMRKDDDWILSSLYDDEGLIHNKLSYDVWQRIAADNRTANDEGIHMEYIELFMDGEYRGVYGLTERIDKKALSLGKKDILYKCRDQADPGEDDFYEVLTEEMTPTFELKYPEPFEMEDWEPLQAWTSVFLEEELADYEQGTALLDMENAVDYNLFNLLIGGMDNIMKNIYFWADYQPDGSYRFIKIPWDLNMTWGNSWVDSIDLRFNTYQTKNLDSEDSWSKDMYHLYEKYPKETGQLMKERWQELRRKILTKEVLTEMAGEQFAYLHASGAYARNAQLWSANWGDFSEEAVYEYIDVRIDFLDAYFGQMGY